MFKPYYTLSTLIILFFSLIFSNIASVAKAQEAESNQLTITAHAAYGGKFKFGEWLPIFVTVENKGPDLDAEIQVRVEGRSGKLDFVVPAQLPSGTRKQFSLYALPNNFSRNIVVELIDGETVLSSHTLEVQVVFNDRYVIGLVAANPGQLNVLSSATLSGRREGPLVVPFELTDLADRAEGLAFLNTLILNDVDTQTLNTAQQTALQQWVAKGGRLIIGGGPGATKTLAGLPAQLQIATPIKQQSLNTLSALETFTAKTLQIHGPFLATQVTPASEATVLLTQVDNEANLAAFPLIIEQSLALGTINFIALDLTLAPFDAWTGLVPFIEKLFSSTVAWPDNLSPDVAPNQNNVNQLSYALNNLPSLNLPSITFLSLLLISYILLVGPFNYLFLRWRNKLAWAWLTIPALTLAFSGLTYGLGVQLRGSEIIINQLSILEIGQNNQAIRSETYIGVFSPKRETYTVEVQDSPLLRPIGSNFNPWEGEISTGNMRVIQGNPAQVQGFAVNQWSMQSFMAQTQPATLPNLETDLSVTLDGLTGHFKNNSKFLLEDVFIIFGGTFQHLGNIESGKSVEINLSLKQKSEFRQYFGSYMLFQNQFEGTGRPDPEVMFKQNVLDAAVFNNFQQQLAGNVLFIAWFNNSPLTVTINNQEINNHKTSLLYGLLPITLNKNKLILPLGFSNTETIAMDGDVNACSYGPGGVGYYLYRGMAEIKIALPEVARNVEPAQLQLYMRTDGGQVLPTIELFDQINEEWVQLENVTFGPNAIQQPNRFYNLNDASIQVRLSADEVNRGGGGCSFFDLTFEGKEPSIDK